MSYLENYLQGRQIKHVVDVCEGKIRNLKFDAIAVRGISGMLVGSPLAAATESQLIIVRKDTEKTHSDSKVEGWGRKQNILIVDDFIETGETIDQIYESIMEKCDSPKIVGILLYASTAKQCDLNTYQHPDGTDFPVYCIDRWSIANLGQGRK
jgi:adenine/guanine phosphoribosyltransferase-like PRPP-binding protein